MALTWNVSNVKDFEELYYEGPGDDGSPVRRIGGVTETLIFLSLRTKIGTITEANAAEVYRRVHVIEETEGALKPGPKGYEFFSEEDIVRHVGLKTNAAFKDWPKREFNRHMNKIRAELGMDKIA